MSSYPPPSYDPSGYRMPATYHHRQQQQQQQQQYHEDLSGQLPAAEHYDRNAAAAAAAASSSSTDMVTGIKRSSSPPPHHPSSSLSSSSRFPHAPPVNAGPLHVRDGQRKRSYKACLHCRSRKAKCDLGDITAPREPPCSRCRREGRRCEFAPSRRGGNVVGRKRRLLAIEQLKRQGLAEHEAVDRVDRQEQERVRRKREGRARREQHGKAGAGGAGHGEEEEPLGSDDEDEVDDEDEAEAEEELRRMGVGVPPPPPPTAAAALSAGGHHPPTATAAPLAPPPISYVPPPDQITTTQSVVSQTSPLRYAGLQSLLGSPANSLASMAGSSPGAYGGVGATGGRNDEGTTPGSSSGQHSHHHHQPPSGVKRHRPSLDAVTSTTTVSSSRSPPDSKRPRHHLHHHHHSVKLGPSSSASTGDPHGPPPPPPRSTAQGIVRADMHNESDALAILAQASREVEHEDGEGRSGQEAGAGGAASTSDGEEAAARAASVTPGSSSARHSSAKAPMGRVSDRHHRTTATAPTAAAAADDESRFHAASSSSDEGRIPSHSRAANLADFEPVQQGILEPRQVITLCEAFFRWHHHIFPIVGFRSIPRTPEQIAEFSRDEPDLLSAFIIIASRTHQEEGMRAIHERTWALFRTHLSDVTSLGAPSTIGLVEGLLLLAENLPRDGGLAARLRGSDSREGVHGAENRQAWMLIGMAIRLAYGLGLDQIALYTDELVERTYATERATLAWTYCFLFDRHISLRLGKAFWSRGPSLCFRGFSHRNQTGPAAARDNFPTLSADDQLTTPSERDASTGIDVSGSEDDLGSLVQAYVELTQLMSNAHDVLYPSPVRTHSLVAHGEYFKFLDDFNTSLESFKAVWATKRWKTFPLTDIVWCQFHYVRLYISAFSFQAHVERASARAEAEEAAKTADDRGASPEAGGGGSLADLNGDSALRPKTDLFPRGGAASADARYIYESIRAATQILLICVDSLHPGGVLPYLPSRFHLFFQYAAVFLLKAIYSGAMVKGDTVSTLHLIERLCVCLASCSSDKDHPAVRYASMVMVLMKKLAGASSESQSHTRRPTPPQETHEGLDEYAAGSRRHVAAEEGKPVDAQPGLNSASTQGGDHAAALVTGLSSLVRPPGEITAASSGPLSSDAPHVMRPLPQHQHAFPQASSFADSRMHPLSHPPVAPAFGMQPPSSSSMETPVPPNRTDGAAGNNSDMGMQYPAGTSYSSSSMMPSSSMPQHLAQRPDNHGVYSSVGAPGSNGMGAWLQQQPASQQQHTMSSLPTFLAGNGGMGGAPPPPTAFNLDGGNASGGAAGGGGIPFDHLFDPNFVETNALDGLYDFDLAEFWTKVYPGEANGGFPFR